MKDRREVGGAIRELEFNLVPHSWVLLLCGSRLQSYTRDISRLWRGTLNVNDWPM